MINKLKRVMIKEEFVKLTGDIIQAIILNQFIYWSERVSDFDRFIAEEKARAEQSGTNVIIEPTGGWIYKTAEELSEETMLNMAPNTILRHIKKLLEKGWLDERNNPVHRWDRTKQYRVNLIKVHDDLLEIGYTLQDYKIDLPFSKMENAFSKIENGTSKTENGNSKMENRFSNLEYQTLQNGKAIPEITTIKDFQSFNHSSIHHVEDDRARAKIANCEAENVLGDVNYVDNISGPPASGVLPEKCFIVPILKNAGFDGLPVEVEYISKWAEVFPREMIEHAVNKAVLNGKKSLPYIAGIFEDWLKKGVKSIEEAEKETRYDSIRSKIPKEKNQDPGRIIKLPDPQVFKDYLNRRGG